MILNGLAIELHAQDHQQNKQQPTSPQDLFLACREVVAEVDFLRKKIAGLDKLSSEKDSLIDVLNQRIMLLEKTIESLKRSLELSGTIEQVDQKIVKSFEASLKAAQDEVTRQTRKAGFWKRISGYGITTALIFGVVIGVGISR